MHKYPKLLTLLACIALAYLLFQWGLFNWLEVVLNGHGYVSVALGGLLFSTGFTTPFAIAIFIAAAPDVHPLIAAPLAGVGALLSDLMLFKYARLTLFDELHRLQRVVWMRRLRHAFHRLTVTEKIRMYALWAMAGFVIASPLPDELGVTLLSGVKAVHTKPFALLCFALNTVGIFLILLAAH